MKNALHVEKTDLVDDLEDLKSQYVQEATAPLDGMWLCGFVPQASHFSLFDGGTRVGYYCVDEAGYLLQLYLDASFQGQGFHEQSTSLFDRLISGQQLPSGEIKGVFVSTAEPFLLSLCLDRFSNFRVNALMYELDERRQYALPESDLGLVNIQHSQLKDVVDFAVENIGAPAEWLTGYYENLIHRQELYGVFEKDCLIAAGESRGYDAYQVGHADLGVIVAKSHQGQGMATRVLRQLVADNRKKGLLSICSTEKSNLGAQKAISRAGFISRNRILQFFA